MFNAQNGRKEVFMIVAALAVLVACFAPASFAGERLTADLNEPFEFDGTLYSPSEIMVYELSAYLPGATLTELRIDGRSVGLVVARESDVETVPARDELIFDRSAEGHLVLSGVAFAGRSVNDLEPLYNEAVEEAPLRIALAE